MAEQLTPGVWRLELGWPPPIGANAYLVEGEALTLVDAGLPFSGDRLRSELAAIGVAVGSIDRVLLTHYDLDHVGGLRGLRPELDAPVHIGERDLALLAGRWTPPGWHPKALFHRASRRLYRLPSSLPLTGIRDGDRIGAFHAVDTPGHNPGHVSYLHESTGTAFLGDLVWAHDDGLTIPVWLDSYDIEALRDSVRRLARDAPPFEVAAVGHGTPLRSGGHAALEALAGRVDAISAGTWRLLTEG